MKHYTWFENKLVNTDNNETMGMIFDINLGNLIHAAVIKHVSCDYTCEAFINRLGVNMFFKNTQDAVNWIEKYYIEYHDQ